MAALNTLPRVADEAAVVTKAVLRAAERLALPNRVLAATLGLSEATISRMGSGTYRLTPGDKPFEIAVLFLRLFRALDHSQSSGGIAQPGLDRISFHVPDDLLALVAVSNPTVKIVLRPEGAGTLHDPVRLKGRSAFDPCDLRGRAPPGFSSFG